ncbi:MAG: hypothetical protein ABEI78_01255 [Candidatus Nanohaloarchaea archaeon]
MLKAYNKWMIARHFNGISREDIKLVGVCKMPEQKGVMKTRKPYVGLTENEILLYDNKGLSVYKKEIPYEDILLDDIEVSTGRDLAKENKITAYSFFANSTPISTYKFKKFEITLPLNNGEQIKLKFEMTDKGNKKLVKGLKKKLPIEKKDNDSNSEDTALEELKKKLVRNEISEEEFEKKKELLRD